ncbi:competence-specific global transcription modulator [Streptococcus pneumoniae]|nr:competence-specific global transcription modulator [Streptococcus pneumoniae]
MIKELYEEVQGTVYKCRNEYYLHLWELSDWDQEGMLCLHELISREEGLVDDIPRLRKYFKTKFRNRNCMKKSKGLCISVEMNITFIYGNYRIGTKKACSAYMN